MPQLNPTQRQILEHLLAGKLNKEIAFELHLSEGTIKEYLNRIFRKVGVANRTQLAVWAVKRQPAQQPNEFVA